MRPPKGLRQKWSLGEVVALVKGSFVTLSKLQLELFIQILIWFKNCFEPERYKKMLYRIIEKFLQLSIFEGEIPLILILALPFQY